LRIAAYHLMNRNRAIPAFRLFPDYFRPVEESHVTKSSYIGDINAPNPQVAQARPCSGGAYA